MAKRWFALYGLMAALLLGGCQSQQAMDESAPGAEPQTEVAEDERSEGGVLEAMAFWNWGKQDEAEDDLPPPPPPPAATTAATAEPRKQRVLTERDIFGDMSPELTTRAMSGKEIRMRAARTIDLNGRSAWDDVLNLLMLDRPNRLSYYPTP